MTAKKLPSADVLRQLLRYDPATGKFFWKIRDARWFTDGAKTAQANANAWNSRYAGVEAFTSKCPAGYVQANILGKIYKGHRVAFAMHYGHEPNGFIDHINRNRSDNRISNLREADKFENMWNMGKKVGSRNLIGATWHKRDKKWLARITCRGVTKSLGRFDSEEEASAAYLMAVEELHAEFVPVSNP